MKEMRQDTAAAGPFDCESTQLISIPNVCAVDKISAQTKAEESVRNNCSCTPPCVLNVAGTAGPAGAQCWIDNQSPWTLGNLYDVEVRVTCRR